METQTIWEYLESRELTQSNALKLHHQGFCIGMMSAKNARGTAFNPEYKLNETLIADEKDDLREYYGGAVSWYDLRDFDIDFFDPVYRHQQRSVHFNFDTLRQTLKS